MRVRIAIAGTVIGTAAGITISRTRPLVADLGRRPAEATKSLPGDDLVPTPTAIETRGHHHRRAARGRLAVARPDGLRPRRLVQLRPARHARQERRHDRAGVQATSRSATSSRCRPTAGSRSGSSSRAAPSSCTPTRRSSRARPRARVARRPRRTCRPVSPRRAHSCGRPPQEFAASWAFVLEPLDGGRTRLIERFRVRFGDVRARRSGSSGRSWASASS